MGTPHPELQDGEMWLTNAIPGRIIDGKEEIAALHWQTKRVGNHAYDMYGRPINPKIGYRPVFIKESEWKEHLAKQRKTLAAKISGLKAPGTAGLKVTVWGPQGLLRRDCDSDSAIALILAHPNEARFRLEINGEQRDNLTKEQACAFLDEVEFTI